MARGYVDQSIVASTLGERALLREITKRGLTLHRLHRDGRTLRLTGPGVFVTIDGLRSLQFQDLQPVIGPSHGNQ